MKAFVTGSTGLLGSNLVNLLLAQGHEVKALARSAEKARKILTDSRIQIVKGDMEDVEGFAQELAGCDVLFHTAAYFREYYNIGEHWQMLEKINVHGTIRLLEAAEKAGVKKAIYVSSSGVIGSRTDGKPSDETQSPDRHAEENLYMKSKVLAEQALAKFLQSHHLPVVLILPTAILGPQDSAPTAIGQLIVDYLNRKQSIVPSGGLEFVDARDAAQAMVNAVERGQSGQRYIVSGGYHTIAELTQVIERVSGVPVPKFRVPPVGMFITAFFSETAAKVTGGNAAITFAAVRSLLSGTIVTSAKAKRELGITLRSFEETVRDEVNWYQANGYVTSARPLQPVKQE